MVQNAESLACGTDDAFEDNIDMCVLKANSSIIDQLWEDVEQENLYFFISKKIAQI